MRRSGCRAGRLWKYLTTSSVERCARFCSVTITRVQAYAVKQQANTRIVLNLMRLAASCAAYKDRAFSS